MIPSSLEIRRSSASLIGGKTGVREVPVVAKYIDTSTCIGCKACEAACAEWNDLPSIPTHQFGSYQTMPTLDADFWNLIRFHEREVVTGTVWLMREDNCMHCEDRPPRRVSGAGCDRAVREWDRRREPRRLHRVRHCETGCRSTSRGSTRRPRRCRSARCASTA